MQSNVNEQQLGGSDNGIRKNLLTIGEASEYLGVSIDTLRRWEKRGRIEAYRSPGGHRHYDKKDLDKLFDKRYVRDEQTIRRSSKHLPENSEEIERQLEEEYAKPQPIIPVPVVTLPAWRKLDFEEKEITVTQPVPQNNNLIEERVLDRPVREVKIPEVTRLRITPEPVAQPLHPLYAPRTPESVLTPSIQTSVQPSSNLPTPPPANIKSIDYRAIFEDNKKLIVYGSLVTGLVLFVLGWYFLWVSSQRVLSPIP